MKIKLFVDKSVEQNAEVYFEKAKKAKKKLKGARVALEKSLKSLRKHEKQKPEPKKPQEKPSKKEWYEKFRWFISSTGFLVIGGRDATSNEIVIKKHTDPDDLVFHTDMAGSPFFVIQAENKKIDQETIEETAIATASFSRAWKLNIPSVEVFYVTAEQVTKKAKAGEYIAKGAFMVYGKKNYIRADLKLAVGKKDKKIICGPIKAVKSQTKKFMKIEQGNKKSSDIAKQIQSKYKGHLDDIIRILPTGNIKII